MTPRTSDRATAQAAFDAASFTMPVTTHLAGRPTCPACMSGQLVMFKTAMAYDSSGSHTAYLAEDGTENYPAEPTGCYILRVMTCRQPRVEGGCGFAVPLEHPTFMLALKEGIDTFRDPIVKLDD